MLGLFDAAILAAYDGKPETINRLAREHNLTEVHVYRVIKQQRSAERTRRRVGRPLRSSGTDQTQP